MAELGYRPMQGSTDMFALCLLSAAEERWCQQWARRILAGKGAISSWAVADSAWLLVEACKTTAPTAGRCQLNACLWYMPPGPRVGAGTGSQAHWAIGRIGWLS